jgi:hypothetical protein
LGAKLSARAVGSLHEFGRFMNDLEYRAKRTHGAEDAKVFLLQWLKDIGYEKHLYDGEDNEKVAAARWSRQVSLLRHGVPCLTRKLHCAQFLKIISSSKT